MKVTVDEIVKALHFCRSMGAWAEKSCDLANRIEAEGIEQPSIDALIADIDGLAVTYNVLAPWSVNYKDLSAILDKYRGQK